MLDIVLEGDGRNPIDKNLILFETKYAGEVKELLIPVRCFTCGAVIGDKWEEFSRKVAQGESPEKVLDDLGVKRYCCRRMLLSHVDLIYQVIKFTRPA